MKFLSVCSGIEAASVAWNPLGWEAEAFSEIEPFPCQVLKHHYPDVPNMGDMTKFKEWNLGPIDLFCGGTPCQSFSVAGLRKGLDDPRGNLMLTYLAIADKFRPRWLVWENVPGVLSSNGGRDFGAFLGGLGQLGYGFAYRMLDAQYFGVAQRRRRVFVVGYLGDWRPAAAVLFERDSLRGNPAPSRKARQETSHCLTTGSSQRYDAESETMIPVAHTLRGEGFDASEDGTGRGTPLVPVDVPDVAPTLTKEGTGVSRTGHNEDGWYITTSQTPAYGIPGNWIGRKPENGGNAVEPMHDVAPCLTKTDQHGVAQAIPIDSMNHLGRNNAEHSLGDFLPGAPSYTLTKQHSHAVAQPIAFDLAQITSKTNASRAEPGLPFGTMSKGSDMHVANAVLKSSMQVRRLLPVECERLQGFPDHYTDIKPKGKPTPDGPRYKALGNSWAVPVVRWIGERIMMVEGLK